MANSESDAAMKSTTYSAPALEKGLDILELLANSDQALTAREIGDRLGRSKNEIFRMVFVLLDRGYLVRDAATDQMSLSNRLFELGMRTPRTRQLVEIAMPALEHLGDETGFSAHLVVLNKGETIVVAAAAGRADFNFTLRLGYRMPAIEAISGQTIIAFQSPETRQRMVQESLQLASDRFDPQALDEILERTLADGYSIAESHDIVGITDICAPILGRNGNAVGSIVIPCLQRVVRKPDLEAIRDQIVEACNNISGSLL